MPNRVGSDYKLRVVWDELIHLHHRDVTIYNRPHVQAFLRSRSGRFIVDHVQNLCWTLERLFTRGRPLAPGADVGAGGISGRSDSRSPRIFLDITNTSRNRHQTGIQRVCRRLAEEGLAAGLFVPTAIEGGELYALDAADGKTRVDVKPDDVFVVLDTFWDPIDEYVAFITGIRARGVLVATCFYDIVPSLHPEICALDFGPIFTAYLERIYEISDICFAISKATLDDLIEVLSRSGQYDLSKKKFFFFHLGADFTAADIGQAVTNSASPPVRAAERMFLSVGTIEPKKGYHLTLDAFDMLWAAEHDVALTIIGKYGWGAESVQARIEAHPQLGKKLFWLRNSPDDVLEAAYRTCYCFIQASVAEGFGIPVIEAAKHEVPIIASDIDVFKEIGGDRLVYFESENAASLRETILAVLTDRPVPRAWPILSWGASLSALQQHLIAAIADLRTEKIG